MEKKEIEALLNSQREFFREGNTLKIGFRKKQLKTLRGGMKHFEKEFEEALWEDLHKCAKEAHMTEISFVQGELKYMLENLERFMRAKWINTTTLNSIAESTIVADPYGTSLIISPWNYPLQLSFCPLIGAIAAGNTAILKPSRNAKHTGKAMKTFVDKYLDPQYIALVEAGPNVNQNLMEQQYDKIYFTGSTSVGKSIMASAANHLTPVSLELGGKSPAIVTKDMRKIKKAAKRIAWAKYLNSGQTCVAVDYAVVHKDRKEEFIEEVQNAVKTMYGVDPQQSQNYGRIINQTETKRLQSLLDAEKGNVVFGGKVDIADKYVAPTIIDNVNWKSKVMEEEIFGPLLPVLEYENEDDLLRELQLKPKPLASYIFTFSSGFRKKFLSRTSAGGVTINDTLSHVCSTNLPFGGVGESGMGKCRGHYTFQGFTHYKPVVKRRMIPDIPLKYPPYSFPLGLYKWALKTLL